MKALGLAFSTILAIVGAVVLIRLGLWQLDRLEQRRSFNQRVSAQLAAPVLDLSGDNLSLDLAAMEYRAVTVEGAYDFSEEVALRNQSFLGLLGYRLLTPLKIDGSEWSVLVDRGFVPASGYQPGEWQKFSEPVHAIVQGLIRDTQTEPDFGGQIDPTPAPGAELLAWNLADVARIGSQVPYRLLPVFIQQSPPEGQPGLVELPESYPVRTRPELELSEGPHLSYAIQWFTFAAILIIGYPVLIFRSLRLDKEKKGGE